MKQLFTILALSVLLFSCSKSSDDDNDDDRSPSTRTTVNFSNRLGQPLTNMLIGSWKGTAPAKLIKNVGTLAANTSTDDIVLTDNTITKLYIYSDFSGETYMTPYGFSIVQGTFNNWQINTNVIWDKVNKTSDLYPR